MRVIKELRSYTALHNKLTAIEDGASYRFLNLSTKEWKFSKKANIEVLWRSQPSNILNHGIICTQVINRLTLMYFKLIPYASLLG